MSKAILKLGPETFHPTSSLSGNEAATVIRGKNMMLRGEQGSYYFESFAGIKNLHENIPSIILQGTISFDVGKNLVRGSGTSFKDELHIGQFIHSGGEVLVVEEILDDTHFLCDRPPFVTRAAQQGYKMPILFEMNNKRGTMIWGNALKFDLGNIVAVGEGQLRINGQVLPGQSLISNRQVKIAIFNPATAQYRVEKFGYHIEPRSEDVVIRVVAGGKKNMTLGYYSFRWSWANKETAYGFSNPSDVIKVDGSGNSLAVNASNQRFKLDFTQALTHKPSNADSVIIYRSFYQTGARANPISFAEGSWFVAKTVQIADFEAGDVVYVDVLDEELGAEVSFDNDPPPDAEWVSALAGDLVLLSCYGEKTVANPNGTSPGPMLVPQRRGNRDAFPADTTTPLSPPDTIIGFAASVGRIFLMTRIGLPFATSTGQADAPITTRPFWQTGFKGPFGLCFVNDALYAFTSKGVTRSIAAGDEGSEQFAFAAAAEEITRTWFAGHVHTVHDPANELVCFIYSAAYKNSHGWWVSVVLPFSLRQQAFMPLITIEKPGRDMVVCGAAKVNGHMQFLAGGRGIPEVISSSSSESSVESSVETPSGSSTEVIAPLVGGIFCCGGECGVDGNSSTGAHVASDGGNFLSFDTSIKRTGERSIKINAAPYGAGVQLIGTRNTTVYAGKLYMRFEQFPGKHVYILHSGTNNADIFGIAYNPDRQELNTRVAWDAPDVGGMVIDLHTWYRIDFLMDRSSGTVNGIITQDGNEANTTVLPARTNTDIPTLGPTSPTRYLRVGTWGDYPGVGLIYVDDILVSNAAGDYPLGKGYCRAFVPTADGTHNITDPNRFKKGLSGISITNATTDAYTQVDMVPMHTGNAIAESTDFIKAQPPNLHTDYVEVKFGPKTGVAPTVPPRIVSPVTGGHQNPTPSDRRGVSRVMLVDNHTLSRIWQHSDDSVNTLGDPPNDDPSQGNATVEVHSHFIINPPSQPGQAWKVTGGDGNFNKLRARYYSLYEGTLPPQTDGEYWDGTIIEAEFEGDAP